MITENSSANNWARIITEEYGVTDREKLSWVSQYAQNHAIYEDAGSGAFVNSGAYGMTGTGQMAPGYSTPLNTIGMGNPAAPQNPNPMSTSMDMYGHRGSGDVPMSTLPMALNVALHTVGLELVPVVPSKGPWQMLSYMDFPYAGGKLGQFNETSWDGIGAGAMNKPKYVKLSTDDALLDYLRTEAPELVEGAEVEVKTTGGVIAGTFKKWSMVDGKVILEVKEATNGEEGAAKKDVSISSVCRGQQLVGVKIAGNDAYTVEAFNTLNNTPSAVYVVRPDFVQSQVDLIDGYANFATGEKEPMTRAQNETGTGNAIGLRLFSQWIQMGSYEVTGSVTRQQLQDLPLYGVEPVAKVMEAMTNELTQHINQRILGKVRELGAKNHANQKRFNGTDLDLDFTALAATEQQSFDNVTVRQRRIATRIQSASALILQTGRRGGANWVVTSAKIASALCDIAAFNVKGVNNTLVQDATSNLYCRGTLGGLQVYVDPYQSWNDNTICVGRKGDANSPGVIFMPYILADTVTITAEGTMAPKLLVNSRFAIVEAGFYPELMYYTFTVNDGDGAYPII